MNTLTLKRSIPSTQLQCFTYYIMVLIPVLAATVLLRTESFSAFQLLQFTIGLISWTFIEYIVHRFWMHGKGNALYMIASKRHLYHHSHPHDLKITALHRTIMFLLLVVLVVFSLKLKNYFTMFTGFYSGFVLFCFMHLFLHQNWCRTLFPKLVRYHMFHHCKYPDRCHGVTVTWWDDWFGTAPPPGAAISERILQFYFDPLSHPPKKSPAMMNQRLATNLK